MTCAATISTISLITGLTLPGMIELPGCVAGMLISPMPAARARCRASGCRWRSSMRLIGDRLQLPGGLDDAVLRGLRLEVVLAPRRTASRSSAAITCDRLRRRNPGAS